MNIKCPCCQTEYDLEPGKYECECGGKFFVQSDGSVFRADSDTTDEDNLTDRSDLDRTVAPQQGKHFSSKDDLEKTQVGRRYQADEMQSQATMPGKRDRKPDGRFEPGDLIMGRYKVLAELGQGGMGVVYKCFDETAGIEIALKALPPELSHNTLEMEDIKENFQLVAKLVHQNIAISKNLERDNSNGNYYLIMECVEGEDLRRWIKRKRRDGSLTIEVILPVIRQIAEALDYAHEQKIIHRDIKPGNIMIDTAGNVKVLDFGLAAQIHSSMSHVSMAYHGTSGTGPYMAPEQWRGRAQGAAADQYALAVMTYEMLAGHLPFDVSDPAVLREVVLNETPERLQDVPEHVVLAIECAMSKDAAQRFSSCSAFSSALEGGKFEKNKQTGSLIQDSKKKRYRLVLWGCVGILALIVLGIFIFLSNQGVSSISKSDGDILIQLPGNVKLEMVKIIAGTFTMGSSEDELGRHKDEKQHHVTLTRDYWLGKYEVTQAQWKAIMGDNPSQIKRDNYPVENVSWENAKNFCDKLNERYVGRLPKGYRFDLPTDAQWEYACRAGTTTALNNGKNLRDELYHCENLYEVGWYDYKNNSHTTHDVGRKRPNEWGLYDMHGNVWEWCRNYWYDYSYGNDTTDPIGPMSGTKRVLRGGSAKSIARNCRSATRISYPPSSQFNYEYGFRLALVPDK